MTKELESFLEEERIFPPPEEFSKRAYVQSLEEYKKLYEESIQDPEGFWTKRAKEELHWFREWDKVLEWDPPFAKWFLGGKLNVAYNCLDRHLKNWRKNKAAIVWEGERGEVRTLTYWELYCQVGRLANWLKAKGIQRGDRVVIYLPLLPEAAIAMLACARIGAIHSVVFGGFSATALRDRIQDTKAKALITADGGFRRGKVVPLKKYAEEALKECPFVETVLVVQRTDEEVPMKKGRDYLWQEEIPSFPIHCPCEEMDSEDPLFILYTSGTTGKPKGILHTTGGYLLGVTLSTKWVFDLKEEDTYWCTADVGWITGHSYVVYGPLSLGGTTFMYEGAPDWPDPGRFWKIIQDHRVSIFYTAPTAIRAFMRFGDKWVKKYDLSSLRLLGTVGEPINPEAWLWYHTHIGGGRCPIVDTWWQTETGAIMITPLPGATPTKPGSATLPFVGVVPEVVDEEGKAVEPGKGGYLVISKPWPSMLRTLWGDEERYRKAYWSRFAGKYFTGDGARQDKDGYFWIMGRVDDVINVSGHRLGTMEVESALVSHPKVAEAAVVGMPHPIKGEALCAFVVLREGVPPEEELKQELREHVSRQISPIAKPEVIRFAQALPKTRSGKIMRRLLRDIAVGRETVGDTSTLEDYSVLTKLREEQE